VTKAPALKPRPRGRRSEPVITIRQPMTAAIFIAGTSRTRTGASAIHTTANSGLVEYGSARARGRIALTSTVGLVSETSGYRRNRSFAERSSAASSSSMSSRTRHQSGRLRRSIVTSGSYGVRNCSNVRCPAAARCTRNGYALLGARALVPVVVDFETDAEARKRCGCASPRQCSRRGKRRASCSATPTGSSPVSRLQSPRTHQFTERVSA
jgi:hypothetical protein